MRPEANTNPAAGQPAALSATPSWSTLVAIDHDHCHELQTVWPTWRVFKPEILSHPLVIIADREHPAIASLSPPDARSWLWGRLAFLDHPDRWLCLWPPSGATDRLNPYPFRSQREKMLNSLVYVPGHGHLVSAAGKRSTATGIFTDYYLKLDTDVIATAPGQWMHDWWFRDNPVFIASPWGYTKPADAINTLDDWGDEADGIRQHPRLNIPFDPAARLVRHRRIISWCFFGQTRWTEHAWPFPADGVGIGRLPVGSQDTYLGFCAARRRDFYRAIQMKRYGWRHVGSGSLERLKAAADAVLSAAGQPTASVHGAQLP